MIIGFSGRARHGKTESCEAIKHFVESYHCSHKTAGIYDIGNQVRLYCIENHLLPQVERKDMDSKQLQVLIDVGRMKRAQDEDFWMDQIMDAIMRDGRDVALIPNLRYENEVRIVRSFNGYVVRVTRLNRDGSTYISRDRNPNDASETTLQNVPADFYLTVNSGHPALVQQQAVALYKYLVEWNHGDGWYA